jgi:twitching motility protein PilI
MAKEDLKEFQDTLARRLREANDVESTARLGLESAGRRYLLRLDEAGEVLPLPPFYPVPLTRSWYLGLANVRGNLVSVVDLAAFGGEAPTPRGAEARLVLFAERFAARSSLLVTRMLGLKNLTAFEPVNRGSAPSWVRACYAEKAGAAEHWNELDLGALIADEKFLQVSR